MLMGDMPMAEQSLGQAFQASPNDPRITNNLALVVGYQGNLKEALTLFRRCNAESEALANVGYLLSQRGDMEKARQYFHEALNLDPTLRQAADGLVEVDKAMKLMAAAIEQPVEAGPFQPVVQQPLTDIPPMQR
jgi:Flp pilus assembly protein TadD